MRLQSLEGWRGFTALLVILFHLNVAHALFGWSWLRSLMPILEFFFIVSGFVMALGFHDKVQDGPSFWNFIIRRFGRVWPLHWAMLGILVAVEILRYFAVGRDAAFTGLLKAETLPAQILLLQTWIPGYPITWNFPSWTLSAEIFAYTMLGLILLVSRGARLRIALAALAALTAGIIFYHELLQSPGYNVASVPRCLTGFFIGVLTYEAWRRWPIQSRRTASILEAAAFVAFFALPLLRFDALSYFLNHAVYVFLIYVFASDRGFLSKVMSVQPLMWLGKLSFSIYMFHAVVLFMMWHLVDLYQRHSGVNWWRQIVYNQSEWTWLIVMPHAWMNNLVAVVYVVVVLTGATFIYRWVENPSRIYFAKLAGARKIVANPAPDGATETT